MNMQHYCLLIKIAFSNLIHKIVHLQTSIFQIMNLKSLKYVSQVLRSEKLFEICEIGHLHFVINELHLLRLLSVCITAVFKDVAKT